MAANTETLDYGVSGKTIYVVARSRTTGLWWNGATMAAYADGNWATYDMAMTENGTSGIYEFTAPGGLPADDYDFLVRLQAGGSPALTDGPVSAISDHWDGTSLSALGGGGGGGGSDPWTTALPGAYGAGTAGNIVGNRLDAAVTSRPSAAAIDTQLSGVHGAGSWVSVGDASTIYGTSGALTVTFTELDPAGLPLSGVEVWVSSDVAGAQRSQSEISDTLGNVQFRLDSGTVYVWREKAGYAFTPNPKQVTIS